MAGLNNTYNFKIKVLSPISIGNEQEAVTSFLEYIVDKDYLYYLDLNKLAGIENKKIEDFIAKMKKGMFNNSYRESFSNLVKETLDIDIENLLTGEKYRINGLEEGKRLTLRGLLKTRNRPYISGSTMKGAIKSAILYNWLMNEGNSDLKTFLIFINSTHLNLEKDIKRYNEIILSSYYFNEDQKAILRQSNNAILNFKQLLEYKDLSKQQNELTINGNKDISNAKNNIENEFSKMLEAKLFPGEKPKLINGNPAYRDNGKPMYEEIRYDASFLRVIDSPSIDNQSIVVESMKRINIYKEKSKESAIPFLVETVEEKTLFDFQIQIPSNSFKLNQITHPSLKFLQSKDMYKTLFKILNRFSEDFIKEELAIPSNVILKNFYEELENDIADTEDAIMRIGFGKHFLNTSMALAVKKEDKEIYLKLLDIMMNSDNSDDFPVTRTLTSDNRPLGWIKLSFESEKQAIKWQKV